MQPSLIAGAPVMGRAVECYGFLLHEPRDSMSLWVKRPALLTQPWVILLPGSRPPLPLGSFPSPSRSKYGALIKARGLFTVFLGVGLLPPS